MDGVMVGTRSGLHTLGGIPLIELEGRDVGGIVGDDGRRWAVVDGTGIWGSDGGEPWIEAARVEGLRANCLLPVGDTILLGTSQAHLFRLAGGRMAPDEAFDLVEGRPGWYTPWGGPPDSRSMARGADGAIYVNVHVGGIPRSRDGGRTWEPTIDIDADVHQVIAAGDGTVLAATARGLAVSPDGGDTWRFETDGLHATYCRAVAVAGPAGDTVLLTVSRSHRGQQAAVYRWRLDGGAFERCREGLPEWFEGNIDTACLAASGNRAAFGTVDGSVFVSEDGGATWARAPGSLPSIRCLMLS
jgi:hypothetical protein